MDQRQPELSEYCFRAAPLGNLTHLLSGMGCDADAVFKAAGLNPVDFIDPDLHLSYRQGGVLFEEARLASDCDHVGLLLGQWFLPTHLGFPGRVIANARDVRGALNGLVDNFDLHDRGGLLALESKPKKTSVSYEISTPDVPGAEQIREFVVTCLCATMRALCGVSWNPTEVTITRRKPADVRPYKEYFQSPVSFDASRSRLTFATKWLDTCLDNMASESLLQVQQLADELHATLPRPYGRVVEQMLYVGLPNLNTAGGVAGMLGVHERTLHRKLLAEGRNFRSTLDDVRRTASNYYLLGTTLSIQDIARALGYSSTASFNHAFNRWHRTNPRSWKLSQINTTPPSNSE